MTAFAHVDGHPAVAVSLHVSGLGPWFADVELERDPEITGGVTLALGELELEGTIDTGHAGSRGLQRMLRIIAGANGWGRLLPAKAYHSDSGIEARTIVDDAVREAGETLDGFAPEAATIGRDYVRTTGLASRVLEDVIGARLWWVAYDGRTHVGQRADVAATSGTYEVLEYDPISRVATLAVDDLRSIVIGSVLSDRLDEPQTVRELEVLVTAEAVRVRAICEGSSAGRARIARALRSIIDRATDGKVYGPRLYRVVRLSGDRLELQAVDPDEGLPDLKPISMWPGVAGTHGELTAGTEVLVEFISGDRRRPIVTHFAGKDGTGFVPVSLLLDASGASASLKLGAGATKPPAWAGELRTELVKIAGALAAAQAPPGGGPLTWAPGTDYPVSGVPAASALGAAKTVCE